ncbi:PadR family transcriptional regulator [Arundinibacter roseus]|uniref:PadR family transcriptional regulator n=1 Tax=Arundinibacter roseus TaxID=2070510 RepID=A0A4R4KIZ9_9BACT|nr:PadR family transcriptional regulator [Arundinibacter roseus]TDB66776.1 PadR family transcriptional regulator [Arundinibacter roseus]
MENSANTSNEYVRGTLKTIVLNLLAERGRMYGYEITQEVKDRTKGEILLTFGALYPVLHKLEQEGLLSTESEPVDGRMRKYYTLTTQGSETARTKTNDLERFMEAMKLLLSPPGLAPERG